MQSEPVEIEILKRVNEYHLGFMQKSVDIISILWDIQIGLRNEFLSKLFNYLVPLRKRNDETLHVYRVGFEYNK